MARIRTTKPEFWSSPDTAACADPWARLLFMAMWNWADDSGRGTCNPKELAGFAFPNDEWISSADIRRWLDEIRRAFGVEFYKVGRRTYYAIPSWDKHQKIDRRSEAKHPAPEEGEDWNPDPQHPSDLHERNDPKDSAEPSENPDEPSTSPRRIPGAGTGEQGNRGTGEQNFSSTTASPSADMAEESTAEVVEPTRFDVEQLCARLRDRMVDNGCKPPVITAQWRSQARLLLDRDERDLDQALRLIDWCQQDQFWSPNILSIPKFRKQYDQLLLKARQEHSRRQSRVVSVKDERVAATLAMAGPGAAERFAAAWSQPLPDPRLPGLPRQLEQG